MDQPTLESCPFCGGASALQRRAPGGTMSSGMEPYMQRIGCAECRIWSEWQHPESEWGKQEKHDRELSIKLASRWNARAS